MIDYISYNKFGEITRSGVCQKEALHMQSGEGEVTMAGIADDSRHYIKNGVITERPVFSVSVHANVIVGIPSGTSVYVDNELAGQCDTGSISLEKENQLDIVSVRLSLFPYIDKEVTL